MRETSNDILKEYHAASARFAENELGEAILHITSAAIICIKCIENTQNLKELKKNYDEQPVSNPNKNTAIATLLIYQAGYHAENHDYLECYKCFTEAALQLGLNLYDLDATQFEYSSTEELHSLSKEYVTQHTKKIFRLLKNDK
ncbi:hypothetical protein [Vibrio hepatarius]|uniref:hypothetical protein n=1 Tax=Vibrio hepatarius TaxID=171383 RepID=UPI001C093CC4|nr:hypothetical protein [Vibrio hepatarius]MBU2895970.1 hypothetical protein [Vibrio hepatarius]